MKVAMTETIFRGYVRMKTSPERHEAVLDCHSWRQEVQADGDSKMQIQHVMLRSDKVVEETNESERSHYGYIDLPPTAIPYFTTAC